MKHNALVPLELPSNYSTEKNSKNIFIKGLKLSKEEYLISNIDEFLNKNEEI